MFIKIVIIFSLIIVAASSIECDYIVEIEVIKFDLDCFCEVFRRETVVSCSIARKSSDEQSKNKLRGVKIRMVGGGVLS